MQIAEPGDSVTSDVCSLSTFMFADGLQEWGRNTACAVAQGVQSTISCALPPGIPGAIPPALHHLCPTCGIQGDRPIPVSSAVIPFLCALFTMTLLCAASLIFWFTSPSSDLVYVMLKAGCSLPHKHGCLSSASPPCTFCASGYTASFIFRHSLNCGSVYSSPRCAGTALSQR